ncbi:CRISPR-associated protein, Cse3 family [Aquitalea magnusonii]|uniref:CRISPR-associated protein, Cse3 family n=1 Tax=Aquitalea magnusonii TaxID=332411 RepID=A0A3G9GIA1_9NEIS|nr:type I-E CRISPR-associated protein Cas6/Cse3/CasE [Aquitalea magnusonii]BBF86001.1 CRISPR-associated protein, Cse3 family [Aquitalea magnusonii]
MYLSRLKLDSRMATVRRDLASAYDMHRTLSRAFAASDDAQPSRFLWRLDSVDALQGEAVVLIQSEEAGRWQQLPAGYVQDSASKQLDLSVLLQDQRHYRFRLLANPTVSRAGKRYGLVKEEEQLAWLQRQLQKAGCVVHSVLRTRSERWSMRRKGQLVTVQAAGFEGVLAVEQSALLQAAIGQGIGHAKALGLGMLSLAPLSHG